MLQAKEKLKSKAMSEWKELYQKHSSQLGTLVLHGVSRPGTRLCPYCFGTFSPLQVCILQRCSKDGCFDGVPNCSFSISPCNRCHFPYCCLSHLAQHLKRSALRLPRPSAGGVPNEQLSTLNFVDRLHLLLSFVIVPSAIRNVVWRVA